MNKIPIFDSLTHPMPNESWLNKKYDGKNSLLSLTEKMKDANVKWALAVGMGQGIGGYNEDTYAKFITDHADNIFPVAYIDFPMIRSLSKVKLANYLQKLRKLGYIGIKLHPRLGKFSFCEEKIPVLIKMSAKYDLTVLLCTYCWGKFTNSGQNDPFSMMRMLTKLDGAPVILIHGGGVLLMEYIEIARSFPNVLLDLSLTICKYPNSSIDLDINFAFSQFDRRICIGSDSPEFFAKTLRERFNYFSKNLTAEKKENIAYKNLSSFISVI